MADKSPEAKLQEIAERRQRRQESFASGTTSPPPTTSSATSTSATSTSATSATSATSTSSSASASVPAQPRQPRSPPPHTPAKRTLSQGNGLEKAGKRLSLFLFDFLHLTVSAEKVRKEMLAFESSSASTFQLEDYAFL